MVFVCLDFSVIACWKGTHIEVPRALKNKQSWSDQTHQSIQSSKSTTFIHNSFILSLWVQLLLLFQHFFCNCWCSCRVVTTQHTFSRVFLVLFFCGAYCFTYTLLSFAARVLLYTYAGTYMLRNKKKKFILKNIIF